MILASEKNNIIVLLLDKNNLEWSAILNKLFIHAVVTQLFRVPAFQAGCRELESRLRLQTAYSGSLTAAI